MEVDLFIRNAKILKRLSRSIVVCNSSYFNKENRRK